MRSDIYRTVAEDKSLAGCVLGHWPIKAAQAGNRVSEGGNRERQLSDHLLIIGRKGADDLQGHQGTTTRLKRGAHVIRDRLRFLARHAR